MYVVFKITYRLAERCLELAEMCLELAEMCFGLAVCRVGLLLQVLLTAGCRSFKLGIACWDRAELLEWASLASIQAVGLYR